MRRRIPADPEELERLFDWNDPSQYQWAITGKGFESPTLDVVGPMVGVGLFIPFCSYILTAGAFLLCVFGFALLAHLLRIDRHIAPEKLAVFSIHGFSVLMTAVLLMLTLYCFWLAWQGSEKKKLQARSNVHELLTSSIGIIAFVMSNPAASTFAGGVDSWRQWFGYWADNAFRAILLDVPEVFNVHLSNIEPQVWFARLLTVFFRFAIAGGLVSFLWQVYQRRFYQEIIWGAVKECFWECQNQPDRDTLRLRRIGKVDSLANPEPSFAMVDFIDALDMQDFRDERGQKQKASDRAL